MDWLLAYRIIDGTFVLVTTVIRATWWVVVPFFLFFQLKPAWRDWRSLKYQKTLQRILLEIKLPPEVLKTPKAMENVLVGFHGAHSDLGWFDYWFKGESQDSYSLELMGTNGELRFYIRCIDKKRNFVESRIFAQYPDAEIHEVPDYMDDLPPVIPNTDYDMWGADFVLVRDWVYPIRTYYEFEDPEEDRRLSTISQFAEVAAKMQENEYVMMQLIISPAINEPKPKERAAAERDKLMGRIEEKKQSGDPMLLRAFGLVGDFVGAFLGQSPEEQQEEQRRDEMRIDLGALRLSKGEMEVVQAIERKASQTIFICMTRGMYVYRRDVAHREHIAGLGGFFKQFAAENTNGIRPASGVYPSSALWIFKKWRNDRRKRRVYYAYRMRKDDYLRPPYVLSVEEIATMFHIPGRIVAAPSLRRQESKSAQPPPTLPL